MVLDNKTHDLDLPHNIIMEERNKLSISGVTDVESFDETLVVMETTGGTLTVRGADLHVDKLNLENGELSLVGEIQSMEYDENSRQHGGLFGRLFG